MPVSPHSANKVRNVLFIAFGVVFVLAVLSAMASGAGSVDSDAGYVESDTGYSTGSDGGGTEFYDSGSITTTDDGELIYSDNSGNSFSTGG